MNHKGFVASRPTCRHTTPVGNVKIVISQKIVLFLHPHVDVPYSLVVTSLDGELCLRDVKNAAFLSVHHLLPLQASMENVMLCPCISCKVFLIGWHSLGTFSAFGSIANLT